jgi:hypothetical protein
MTSYLPAATLGHLLPVATPIVAAWIVPQWLPIHTIASIPPDQKDVYPLLGIPNNDIHHLTIADHNTF